MGKKGDKNIHISIAWTRYLTDFAQSEDLQEYNSTAKGLSHCCILTQTIGKYAFISFSKENKASVRAEFASISPQPDSGLSLLASACIGQLFRLYKRNRAKYQEYLKSLSKLIAVNKDRYIPVEQRIRDRGGLYVIRKDLNILNIFISKAKTHIQMKR